MSHRAERTDKEVIKNAKFLMGFIKKTDNYHYSQTLNAAGVKGRKSWCICIGGKTIWMLLSFII